MARQIYRKIPFKRAIRRTSTIKSILSSPLLRKTFESTCTTLASLAVLGLAGYSYHQYYKHLVLRKMTDAFKSGDPMLDLASARNPHPDQHLINDILHGKTSGHYHLLIGEKGTGKSSMLLEAMAEVNGEGISMFEAHADLEVFRIRLGKALNYEFHEDYIGSLFSIRGPREGNTAILDIERAFNKLEKVALGRSHPLILIINSIHLLRDDEDGQDLIELIQQRAEQWAAANLITVVLNSDDYWIYERLKMLATRMKVIPVLDLSKQQAMAALKRQRPDSSLLEQVYNRVGGRLTFLNHVVQSPDMLKTCAEIEQTEKTWFLNQCWILGQDMDDDVMDQQKYASAAMVLAQALVEKDTNDPEHLPQIPLNKAREIMTRADFIKNYDHQNIFTIDAQAMVRADSVPMMNAFRSICNEPGFKEHLEATLDRIAAIESLGRTREIVAKDLINGRYRTSGGIVKLER